MRWPTNEDRYRPDYGEVLPVVDYFENYEGPHGFLSNFYPSPITLVGYEYPTVEHYFQSLKATTAFVRQAIRHAKSPGLAKAMGRECRLRDDWELVKVDVMLRGLRAKFAQHADLAVALIETGDALLVEGNTWNDRAWGCVEGEGENLLGLLLMVVRAELRLQRGHKA